MPESVRLRIYGRLDLDGTHRAIIESSHRSLEPLQREGGPPPVMRIGSGDKTCAVMLAEYRLGETDTLFVDRYKLRHLGAKDGDMVLVEEIVPPTAKRVTLRAPATFSNSDLVRFIGKPVVEAEKLVLFSFAGESREVRVTACDPPGPVIIGAKTEMKVSSDIVSKTPVSYGDIGGLKQEVQRIREVVEYPFKFPEVFSHLGVSPPRGIILHGPPGTGKTLIARALAHETGARFYVVSGPEIYSKWYGKSEESLRNVFEEAVRNAPSIVVIDELDALAPRREKTHGDQEQRIVATFLTQMDGLKQLENVVVLGTTNRVDAIDPALRRGGRFECEVYIGPPDAAGREEILNIHSEGMPLEEDVDFAALARRLNAYVGADIASVCREAAYNVLRRSVDLSCAIGEDALISLVDIRIAQQDFEKAAAHITPSGGRGILADIPPVTWQEIGGMADTKKLLEETIIYAIEKPEAYIKVGLRPPTGILLHGPPGTGKTLLARAVATECGAHFIAVKGSSLRSRWLGETEENIHQVFAKARALAPSVIFFDEVDAAVPTRAARNSRDVDAAVNQILAEMDGIDGAKGVVVIGATNRIELMDPAVLRPGRFDQHIEVPLPDREARSAIFAVHLKEKHLEDDVDHERLADETRGFSGADIAEVARDAAWSALRRVSFDPEAVAVSMNDLVTAIVRIKQMLRRD